MKAIVTNIPENDADLIWPDVEESSHNMQPRTFYGSLYYVGSAWAEQQEQEERQDGKQFNGEEQYIMVNEQAYLDEIACYNGDEEPIANGQYWLDQLASGRKLPGVEVYPSMKSLQASMRRLAALTLGYKSSDEHEPEPASKAFIIQAEYLYKRNRNHVQRLTLGLDETTSEAMRAEYVGDMHVRKQAVTGLDLAVFAWEEAARATENKELINVIRRTYRMLATEADHALEELEKFCFAASSPNADEEAEFKYWAQIVTACNHVRHDLFYRFKLVSYGETWQAFVY